MPRNIQFNYMYRDAGNYKLFGTVVFANKTGLSLKEIEERLRNRLIQDQFFTPEEWEIPRLSFNAFDPDLDHSWHEFENLELTNEDPTQAKDVRDFVEQLTQVSDKQ